jgi:hypothetical protein
VGEEAKRRIGDQARRRDDGVGRRGMGVDDLLFGRQMRNFGGADDGRWGGERVGYRESW